MVRTSAFTAYGLVQCLMGELKSRIQHYEAKKKKVESDVIETINYGAILFGLQY